MPARWAARSFSFKPPIGEHEAAQSNLAGHRSVRADILVAEERGDRGDHSDAGRRTVLGNATRREVDVNVVVAQVLPGEFSGCPRVARIKLSAACALSRITLPELAGEEMPPCPGNAGPRWHDLAADRRPGEAVTMPGFATVSRVRG